MSPIWKPISEATIRPLTRAVTMSWSPTTGTTVLVSMPVPAQRPSPEQVEGIVDVQRGGDAVEVQAQLDHGVGDIGVDADHHAVDASQPDGLGDRLQHPRRE